MADDLCADPYQHLGGGVGSLDCPVWVTLSLSAPTLRLTASPPAAASQRQRLPCRLWIMSSTSIPMQEEAQRATPNIARYWFHSTGMSSIRSASCTARICRSPSMAYTPAAFTPRGRDAA